MFYSVFNQKLIVALEGAINTTNANEISEEIDNIRGCNAHNSLTLDGKNLTYISSAGLRVVLKLAKEEKDFEVINLSNDVYDIFEMTGFASMMKVTKALRKISAKGCPLIGEGYCSEVYKINEDTIVKKIVINTTLDDIKRELNVSKQAFLLGVPTAISFDVVDVDGRYGIVYEMLNCKSLRNAVNENLDNIDYYCKKYATLLKTINSRETDNETIPSSKKEWLKKVDLLKDKIEPSHYEKIKGLVEDIEESNRLVHGDCHVKNIMLNGDDLLLIDMDTLSKGNAIFELATVCAAYLGFEKCYQENNNEFFFKMKKQTCEDLFYGTIKHYFDDDENRYQKNLIKIYLACYTHMMAWKIMYEDNNQQLFDRAYNEFKKYIDEVDSLRFE